MTRSRIKLVNDLWTYSIQQLFRENAQQRPSKIKRIEYRPGFICTFGKKNELAKKELLSQVRYLEQ